MATLTTIIDASGATVGARQFQQATSEIAEGARKADASIAGVETRLGGLPSVISTVKTAFAGIFAALTVTAVIREVSEFEDVFARIGVVTGASAEEIAGLADEVRALASTGRASLGQLDEAVLHLVRSDRDLIETQLILEAATAAAAGSHSNLQSVVEGTDKVLKLFDRNAGDAARTLGALSVVSNKSSVEIDNLLGGLKFFAPTAKLVNASLEEVVSIFGVLDDRFESSRAGAFAMRQAVDDLVNPSKDASAAIRALGLTLADVDPTRVGLVQAFENLAKANITAAGAAQIFSGRGRDAAQTIFAQIDGLTELVRETENATGASERLAQASEGTLGGAFRGLTGSVTALVSQLGQSRLSGALTSLVSAVADGIRVLGGFQDELKGSEERAKAVAAVLAGGIAFVGFSGAVKVATGVMTLFNLAVTANPLTLLGLALATVTAALIVYGDELVTVEGRTVSLTDVAGAAFETFAERASFVFSAIVTGARSALTFLIDLFNDTFSTITGFVGQFADAFLPGFSAIFGDGSGALGVVRKFANASIAIVAVVFDGLEILLDTAIAAVANLATFDITSPIESAKRIASQSLSDFGDITEDLGDKVRENFKKDFIGEFANAGKAAALELTNGFKGESGKEALADFLDFSGDFNERLATAEGERVGKAFVESLKLQFVGGFPVLLPGGQTTSGTPGVAQPTPSATGVVGDAEGDAIRNVNKDLQARIDLLTVQNELVRQGKDASSGAVELYQLEAEAIRNQDDALLKLIETLRMSQEESKRLGIEQQKLARAQDFLADSFTDAFVSFVDGSKSAKAAAEDLFRTLIAELLRAAALKAFQQIFGTGGGAEGGQSGSAIGSFAAGLFASASEKGNAFSGGRQVRVFQRGGILSQPTAFGLAGGNLGIAGEAGDEAVAPLFRDSSGNLGVRTSGTGRSVTVNQFIETPDANSFRRSRRMIEQDARNAGRRYD